MSNSEKKSILSPAIALICIILYAGALILGIGRILINMSDRGVLAEKEYNDILDRVSSAAILGFMSRPYQEVIQETLLETETLLGIIISGSNGEYSFEKQNGTVINWIGNSPRFKSGFGISRNPFFRSIWIDGQRNTTVQAIYSYIDYDLFIKVLKDSLIIILASLTLAIIFLLIDISLKSKTSVKAEKVLDTPQAIMDEAITEESPKSPPPETFPSYASPLSQDPFKVPDEVPVYEPLPETILPLDEKKDPPYPKGLYSPRGIGWESYTRERLESELHRCASLEEDLVFIVMENRRVKFEEDALRELADEGVNFFTMRDLVFERGEQGLAMIIPALNLEQGFAKSEEFINRIRLRLTDASGAPAELCMGISSRSGRLVEAERLIFEASEALQKAINDPYAPIVAFKSDPEKYRKFISREYNT